jgi:hypothetical protein
MRRYDAEAGAQLDDVKIRRKILFYKSYLLRFVETPEKTGSCNI